jgi:putative phosphoesterase
VLRVGLISDTHGLLRPEASAFLRGCAHIIHAGDIGSRDILRELSLIAPITAVRGNNDTASWAEALADTELVQFGKLFVYVIHDLGHLDIDPTAAGVSVVVSGHSHKPLVKERNGVLYVNPGSAGPRRFKLPIAAAELRIAADSITPNIVELSAESWTSPQASAQCGTR